MVNAPKVLLADDNILVRDEIAALLAADCEIVGAVGNGNDLLRSAAILQPDVVVTDISMPGLDGIEATRRLTAGRLSPCVVLLSLHAEPALVRKGIAAGALGYVLKHAAGDELRPAIRDALRGKLFISPTLSLPPRS